MEINSFINIVKDIINVNNGIQTLCVESDIKIPEDVSSGIFFTVDMTCLEKVIINGEYQILIIDNRYGYVRGDFIARLVSYENGKGKFEFINTASLAKFNPEYSWKEIVYYTIEGVGFYVKENFNSDKIVGVYSDTREKMIDLINRIKER